MRGPFTLSVPAPPHPPPFTLSVAAQPQSRSVRLGAGPSTADSWSSAQGERALPPFTLSVPALPQSRSVRLSAGPSTADPKFCAQSERRGSSAERLEQLRSARVVLVSACLAGQACRYDGRDAASSRIARALQGKEVVPICPEAGAGLGIPRPAVQLCGGTGADVLGGRATAKVKGSGQDVTSYFTFGARLAVDAARRFGATVAILKERSPSCGSNAVWVDGALQEGEGVTAAALRAAGITVLSDEELED